MILNWMKEHKKFKKEVDKKMIHIEIDKKAKKVIAETADFSDGGTTVIANPTLVGTETALTGLQVGDTKYIVPQGGGGAGIEYVELVVAGDTTSGTLTQEQMTKLENGAFIKITGGCVLFPNISQVYSSTVYENVGAFKYQEIYIDTKGNTWNWSEKTIS